MWCPQKSEKFFGQRIPVSRKNFFRLTGILREQKTIFQSTRISVSRKKFFWLTGILCPKHFSYFCRFCAQCKCPTRTHPDRICAQVQMPYSDPPRHNLRKMSESPDQCKCPIRIHPDRIFFCGGGVTILRAVQMPYPDPPRQDLRSSANALLGPTTTEIAGNVETPPDQCKCPIRTHPDRICGKCRNLTGPVQMPYSDPPRQDLRGGGGGN